MHVVEAVYTEDQREAIRKLMHEEGKTAAEALALAAQGVYGLEPFEMPASSAPKIARRAWAKCERRRLARLSRGDSTQRLLAQRARLYALHRERVDEFSSAVERGEFDGERFQSLIRAQLDPEKLERLAADRVPPGGGAMPSLRGEPWLACLCRQLEDLDAEDEGAEQRHPEGVAA
jgi:hypothetical protein